MIRFIFLKRSVWLATGRIDGKKKEGDELEGFRSWHSPSPSWSPGYGYYAGFGQFCGEIAYRWDEGYCDVYSQLLLWESLGGISLIRLIHWVGPFPGHQREEVSWTLMSAILFSLVETFSLQGDQPPPASAAVTFWTQWTVTLNYRFKGKISSWVVFIRVIFSQQQEEELSQMWSRQRDQGFTWGTWEALWTQSYL